METRGDWYNRIVGEIGSYQDRINKKDYKKYKLDLLLRIAGRVDGFSDICGECQAFRQEITQLVQELGNLMQMPDKTRKKQYSKTIDNIVKHLQKEHKLVKKGYYSGMWIGIGLAIGGGIGTALGNPGIGPGIGLALGVAVGSYLEKRARDEDRII